MVEGIEGINRTQHTGNIKTVENKEVNRNNNDNKGKSKNSIDENKLSSEELKKELEQKIDDMNKIVDTLEENLSFKLHDDTETLMTQVIDVNTKEVLKEMPPKEMLDLAARIHRMVGIIIDEEV